MSVIGTNITIVSNSEGQFLLKLPTENSDTKILVSFIGYKNKQIALSELKQDKHRIELERTSVQLPEPKRIFERCFRTYSDSFRKKEGERLLQHKHVNDLLSTAKQSRKTGHTPHFPKQLLR